MTTSGRVGLIGKRSWTRADDRRPKLFRAIHPICVILLLWPALWNEYPIVFADTGTYLSQAIHRYLGWDRPAFYSLFMLPLHLGTTTWPVVVVQAGLTVLVLDLIRRAFRLTPVWLPLISLFLSIATWLPWIAAELMPDVFTPLLYLLLSLLMFAPSRFRPWERGGMTALAAFMIATQQSSVLLSCVWLGIGLPAARLWRCPRSGQTLMPLLAPGAAIAALLAVNVAGHGRLSISPYGNVFVLARVIYDGPGMDVLRRDCPDKAWLLCPFLDRFPPTSDEFLWDPDSPVILAGGHKAVSADAGAIIVAAVRAEPIALAWAALGNATEQLFRFESGDGLEPWPAQVETKIERDFPQREWESFHAARQQRGGLAIPVWLQAVHRATAHIGILAAMVLLPWAWSRRHAAFLFLALSLLTLPLSAAITGALSTPHDRYQSRIVWLPALMALLTIPALLRDRSAP